MSKFTYESESEVKVFNTVAEYEAWRAGNRFYALVDEMRQAREPAGSGKGGQFAGGAGGGAEAQASSHAADIDARLRAEHNDQVADTWKPLVSAAMSTWYGQGDMQAPITVKGKKILVGGSEISASGVLDTMADALGVAAISKNSGFDEGLLT